MSDTVTPDLIDNVEETKLDEDYESLTHQIEDLEVQNSTLDIPEELSLNTGVNNELLTQMAAKLKTMPRNKILEMINSLGLANQLPDHEFSTFGPGSVKSNRQKIQDKIRSLKSKRTKVVNKQKSQSDNNTKSSEGEPATVSTENEEISNESKVDTIVENEIVTEVVDKKSTEKVLTKNQKRKLRKKASKSKSSTDSTSSDSNVVSSVDSITSP